VATNPNRSLTIVLVLCAVSDVAAVPLLLTGEDAPPAVVGVVVGLLGLLTAAAAGGLGRGVHPARQVAWATRIVDIALALPGVTAGGAATVATSATVLLSLVAVALLARTRPSLATA